MSSRQGEGDVSCETCPAACCKAGSNLVLSLHEHERNRRVMKLQVVAKPRSYPQVIRGQAFTLGSDGKHYLRPSPGVTVPAHYGFYVLIEDCGNLEDPQPDRVSRPCKIYEDRPAACRSYEVGSQACRDARAAVGLDGHDAVPDEARLSAEKMRDWFNTNS